MKNKMNSDKDGLKIRKLNPDSFLFQMGLRPGDRILAVNGQDVIDELDFYFYAAESYLELEVERRGRLGIFELERPMGCSMEVDFHEKPINKCTNRCIFCFIDQMPKGLRSSLYIKDEDFKHSFLNGNYVTLSSATQQDLERIVHIGLSPLFISVHATDPAVRAKMLRNRKAPSILEQLKYLSDHAICFHTQIVVCPGFNDGEILLQTINDLLKFGKSLLSIAVVPVGLTRFRKEKLLPVSESKAVEICDQVSLVSDLHAKQDGMRRIFLADEFFIRAGKPIPPVSYYEEYPQIENGVGLIRLFLQSQVRLKRKLLSSRGKVDKNGARNLVVTASSAFPFIKRAVEQLSSLLMADYETVCVQNRYFGTSVTVAGLLTASDVITAVRERLRNCHCSAVFLPCVMFNHNGSTLDGYSAERISRLLKLPVKVVSSLEEVAELEEMEGK